MGVLGGGFPIPEAKGVTVQPVAPFEHLSDVTLVYMLGHGSQRFTADSLRETRASAQPTKGLPTFIGTDLYREGQRHLIVSGVQIVRIPLTG